MVETLLVDINHADEKELATVPGIGPSLARRIVMNRPFTSHEDVTRVTGIKYQLLERLKPHILVISDDEMGEQAGQETTAELESTPPALPDFNPEDGVATQAVEETPLPTILEASGEVPVVEQVQGSVPDEAIEDEMEDNRIPVENANQVEEEVPEEMAAEVSEWSEDQQDIEVLPMVVPRVTAKTPLPVDKPAAAESVPVSREPEPKFVTRGQAVWIGLLIFIAAVAFGVALSLGILSGINGRLRYASPDQVATLSRDITTLTSRLNTLQDELDSVQQRLDNLEAVSGRVDILETQTESMQADISALILKTNSLDETLSQLDTELTTLQDHVEVITEQTGRFQNVMDGLRDILNNLFPVK